MPKAQMPAEAVDSTDALEAKIARAELQARHYEAQIRILEARRKLGELRRALKAET